MNVVAPDGQVLNKDVDFVLVRSVEGDLGILAHHSPLIANLAIGVARYREDGMEGKIAVCGGFMEVADNKVTIIANTAETSEKINLERAEAAKDRAERRLKEKNSGTDLRRAEIALKRAITRINARQ
mgnify:CR=1 FL=1